MLLFSFQLFLLVWVFILLVGWTVAARHTDDSMLVVGTYLAHDSQEMCQAVEWGRRIRDRDRLSKLFFTFMLYVLSTACSIAFALWQHRRYQEVDSQTSTMMDYAAVCTGFPLDGGPDVEGDIQEFITRATGCNTVGVSVCWDYGHVESEVLTLAINEIRRREARCLNDPCFLQYQMSLGGRRQSRWSSGHHTTVRTSLAGRVFCICRPLFDFADWALGLDSQPTKENEDNPNLDLEEDQKKAEKLLRDLPCTGIAFVIFHTERDRDTAVEALSVPVGPMYKGNYVIRASKEDYEPQAVCWSNFSVAPRQVAQRMFVGVLGTLVAIVLWGMCFYGPYAYFESQTYATTGMPPSQASELTFSMLVVIGNQIMYFLCSFISERVGFRSKDHAQEAYVLLYTGAVLVNTVVDLTIIIYTTYVSMLSQDVRTADGVPLQDLKSSADVFESYPMMKVFGRTLYEYNFPSCFLIPFICEAIFTVVLPYHMGYRLVRTRSVSRQNAESCLSPCPMDLARYGDLIVNVTLATLSFFTASGWILKTFVGLLIGNIFVYIFDHYRVLRQVESFYMASGDVDAAAQRLLSLPCAVLASAVVYQLHGLVSERGGGFARVFGQNLWILLAATFILHIVVHLTLMSWCINVFGHVKHRLAARPYSEVARHWPGNWFTSNPVHCLRSQYLHHHEKPCAYYIRGKEAYLEYDEAHGMYFKPVHRHPADMF